MSETVVDKLKGEGATRTQVRVRVECDYCGELATRKQTYLLLNARSNPASSAFGKDDISRCSDAEEMLCGVHNGEPPSGHSVCSIFKVERFAHMFLRWEEDR